MAVVTDCQLAGKAFHSCLVDPDLSVAADPIYSLAAICPGHLVVFGSVWECFGIDFAPWEVQNFIRSKYLWGEHGREKQKIKVRFVETG